LHHLKLALIFECLFTSSVFSFWLYPVYFTGLLLSPSSPIFPENETKLLNILIAIQHLFSYSLSPFYSCPAVSLCTPFLIFSMFIKFWLSYLFFPFSFLFRSVSFTVHIYLSVFLFFVCYSLLLFVHAFTFFFCSPCYLITSYSIICCPFQP